MTREPTPYDQLMLELINRARENPNLEAQRLINGPLNEGVPSNLLITSTPKQPLAFNLSLIESAESHSEWMLANDVFSHTGVNNTSSQQRMAQAGYGFIPPWISAENIAWKGTTGDVDFTNFVIENYQNLFIDRNFPDRGHRVTILRDELQEIGIASVLGEFTDNNINYNAVMTTQDFAYSAKDGAFLTGVIYTDAIVDDDFYTIGEGIGDITITATRIGTNITYETQNWQSGGYSLYLPTGSYNVSFLGNLDSDPQDDLVTTRIFINDQNIKVDLVTDDPQLITGNLSNSGINTTIEENITNNDNNRDTLLRQPIYRLQNSQQQGTYIYVNEAEKDNILRNFPQFDLEGIAFNVSNTPDDDLTAIYRWRNLNIAGTYLYADTQESQNIETNFSSSFLNEGVAFYVYSADSNQGSPIYRFQNEDVSGTYLFAGENEKNNIIENFDNFQLEGVAFNVM